MFDQGAFDSGPEPAEGPDLSGPGAWVKGGPRPPKIDHSWLVSLDRAARRQRRHKVGSEKAEEAYEAWAEEVLQELPVGWTPAERAARPQVRALRKLSAQLPGPELMLKTAAIDPDRVSEEVLVELLRTNQRMTGWLAAQQADIITAITERRSGAGQVYLAEEVASYLCLSGYAADKLVDRAEALERYPEVHHALQAGRLDARKTDILLEGTESLSRSLARKVHRALLPVAEALTAAQLRKRLATAVIAVDPAQARERHEKAKAARTVRVTPAADGMAWINAFLPAPEAMAVFTAIDALAGQRSADDDRPVDVRRADAFGQVFLQTLNSGYTPAGCPLGTRQGMRPQLIITAGLGTLLGQNEAPAHLGGYGPIDAATAREITQIFADAYLAGTDAGGALVNLQKLSRINTTSRPGASAGRAHHPRAFMAAVDEAGATDPVAYLQAAFGLLATDSYAPSTALREFILARDRTCRFVGCEQPGARCQIDHIEPFTDDLPAWVQTIETNLQLLCSRHHQMKTSKAWQVRRDAAGTTHWTTPSGETCQRPAEVIDPEVQAQSFADAAAKPDPASNPQAHSRKHRQVADPPGPRPEPGPTDSARPATPPTTHHRTPTPASATHEADDEGESDEPAA